MKIRTRAVRSQFHKLNTFETKADYRSLLRVFVTFIPDTTLCGQHFRVFGGEAIETRTAQSILAFNEKPQRNRQLAKCLLIGFDRRQPRRQVTLTVSSPARVEF